LVLASASVPVLDSMFVSALVLRLVLERVSVSAV